MFTSGLHPRRRTRERQLKFALTATGMPVRSMLVPRRFFHVRELRIVVDDELG